MSKYDKLWEYVEEQEGDELVLTFDEIGAIAGVPLDHSFLNYKKELLPHGWEVGKISMKPCASSDWRNKAVKIGDRARRREAAAAGRGGCGGVGERRV